MYKRSKSIAAALTRAREEADDPSAFFEPFGDLPVNSHIDDDALSAVSMVRPSDSISVVAAMQAPCPTNPIPSACASSVHAKKCRSPQEERERYIRDVISLVDRSKKKPSLALEVEEPKEPPVERRLCLPRLLCCTCICPCFRKRPT